MSKILEEPKTSDFVTVSIDGQSFGIAVSLIQDVFIPRSITHVPLALPEVLGVLNLRGRIVTAIDVRTRLGLPRLPPEATLMAVGIEKAGEVYGLIVDGVGEVLSIETAQIDRNPVNLDERWRKVSSGIIKLDGRLLVVLDVDAVLTFNTQSKAA